MVIVDGRTSIQVKNNIKERLANLPTDEQMEDTLIKNNIGELVYVDTIFTKPTGHKRRGFFLDNWIKANFDNYLLPAVELSWDGVILITGMEGSAKSTSTFAFAKYVDPTFPGELIGDGTTRRKCTRIVFTQEQFMEQVDKAQPGQAIVWDEMVLGGLAQDAGSEMQRVLIKKMTTIRKKRLFIFFVIPSIFMLRMYFAVFRTRALIHFYTPDGLDRGYFKFYSYDTKRKLYVRGRKEYNQNCVRADFVGRTINTTGFFFNLNEYEDKKDQAILSITKGKSKDKKEFNAKVQKIKDDRDKLMYILYGKTKELYKKDNIKLTMKEFCEVIARQYRLEYSTNMLSPLLKRARELYGISKSADAELNK